jgi:muramoyltetrapeptide carboxypeptidase LdcA involved in peptidoglycan recycling
MPFGLTNAPAQFQAYINKALVGLVNIIYIVYLDNVLIFLETKKEHISYIREVLQQLREAKLFIKLLKCK